MGGHGIALLRSDELGWGDLAGILRSTPDVTLVGEATTAEEAHCLLERCRPKVVFTSPRVDGEPAIPLLADLTAKLALEAKVVVVAARAARDDLQASASSPVEGYLLWRDLSRESLRDCLKLVLASDVIVASRGVWTSFGRLCSAPETQAAAGLAFGQAERTVLRGLGEGLTLQQIADAENLGTRTVSRAVGRLKERLDAPNLFVLGAKAALHGWHRE